ncbi:MULTISPECIES: FAD-binding domain-containing protein [Cyanophyceae]|uniref:FAD-binding domain-containing protein n=1 Tax=Cyanophyceae TaxID=3028117 RepID=UPI001689780F|nr:MULTISPECIES: FAD-binding domain-containing protein [Cyanophyceae]MBD1917006.1 deoxyribodipyrimidine photo-lyase [Phormidium sp. FACHB-77]MBD2029857.1 deoxyribodipyrimidine photo-lyase [Phormidium sp. FACHB-322]MBD2050355.1 deoxyribodipyrimidine photo-lyase [Leptolyngbya sp. FACHB-60]
MNRTIVWFRRDLRVSDHEPLRRAAGRGLVVPVFVFDRALLHHPETGSARVAFLLAALHALDADLKALGGRLIVRSGDPVQVLPDLVKETDADGIYAHTDVERIYGRVRDARLNQALAQRGMKIRWFEPAASAADLIPYPQYRELWYREMGQPLVPTPQQVSVPPAIPSDPLPGLDALGHRADEKPIPPASTAAARALLQGFLTDKADRYYWQLSYPSAEATTGLSPHIKFGVISVRECVQTIRSAPDFGDDRVRRSHRQLISRLRWGNGFTQRFRYLPQLELRSLYHTFDDDGWAFDPDLYQAWQTGHTGFPIVDAAARCLQATGGYLALNFRTRAIYASFLSNLGGIDWRYGALHFMRHLIDGDCPIDHYQWAMQSGVTHCIDKTWTRIYNPGQVAIDRCDPEGEFIKRWVPELADVHPGQLGSPPTLSGYPAPILNYKAARQHRVKLLEAQRGKFLNASNLLPHLAQMPKDLTPFGTELYGGEVAWAESAIADLFPTALPLADLDVAQTATLRTWFVAHVNVLPPKSRRRKPQTPATDPNVRQLMLLGDIG